MAITLMCFTNDPGIAASAERSGVNWIVVDLEIIGKKERQGHKDTRISVHHAEDIPRIKAVLQRAPVVVRVNPIHPGSEQEINEVIEKGADIVMLPYFKTLQEILKFLSIVQGRAKTCLLLETEAAELIIDDILALRGIDSIHIGLQDLSISKGQKFLFQPLADPSFEQLCSKIKAAGIPFGFGGISQLNEGLIPARYVLAEHYRLGSSMVILGRSFLDEAFLKSGKGSDDIFQKAIQEIRDFESSLAGQPDEYFLASREILVERINQVVASR